MKSSIFDQAGPPLPQGLGRRGFLKGLGGLGVMGGVGGGFLPSLATAGGEPDPEGPIFVLIHQAGGNDTLNTVIPVDTADSSHYYLGRPDLALNAGEVLPLQDGLGFHPGLAQLKGLWDSGDLAIINGVGNPNAVLSHFRSIDIWEGADPAASTGSGWLGRYFEHQCEGAGEFDSKIGIDVRTAASLAFRTPGNDAALTIQNPQFFDYLSAEGTLPLAPGFDEVLRKGFVSGLVDRGNPSSGALEYVTSTLKAALGGSDAVQSALTTAAEDEDEPAFPGSAIGVSLRNVARYIGGGMPTSTYFLTQGGYDTHGGQYLLDSAGRPLAGKHAGLLSSLDGAVGAFATEMKRQGVWDRVVVMVYSEFSRKIVQNGSGGTDHGAAGAVLIAGGQTQSGLYGAYPSLAPEDRILNGSMPMTTDFRRIYRTILERWYGLSATDAATLLRIPVSEHQPLDFLTS
ncbi:MAG: hypothetical protein ACJAQT_001963 [Akkermansiaceae bacterium]|jgi:uncharacterized protein (DUF1501 family)